MHHSAWQALLQHIPVEQHNQYTVVTASGVEIAIQGFLRIEAELVVLKGRLSGSQEQGRIFFIPYKHIDYLGTSQPVKDSDFHEVFGSFVFPTPSEAQVLQDSLPSEPLPVHTNGHADEPPPRSPSSIRPPIRSEVLERFRSSRAASSPNLPRPQP